MTQYLAPSSLHVLVLLAATTWFAFRAARASRLRRWRVPLMLATLWAWACCTPAFTNHWMARLEGPLPAEGEALAPPPSHPTTIIVLSSGQMWTPGGRASPRLDEHGWERLHDGVVLWRHTKGRLVFTGGPGSADQPTLAGQMSGIAQQLGVPASDIALAVGSRNTHQDMVAAQPFIQTPGTVWLVTSALHMDRALAVAHRLGIDARPHPVDYRQIRNVTWRAWIPDGASADRMASVLHEVVGRAYYRWKGWAV